MASNATLQSCLDLAASIESSLASLGDTSRWPVYPELRRRCADFRTECRELIDQKGLQQLAIAFLGPKNAGKTTLLSMLVRDQSLIDQLGAGAGLEGATERILWISTQPIRDLEPQEEESLTVDSSQLINLGCDYTLVDVPGANESNLQRSQAAQRALRAAHIKVLVVEARTLEDASLVDDLQHADGATILPVINQIRPGTGEEEIAGFMERLKRGLSAASILPVLRIRDFQLGDETEAKEWRERAASDLKQQLENVIRREHLDDLLEPQLVRCKERFTEEMREALTNALPATAHAVREMQEMETGLAASALERLLGADERDRGVITALRQQLRGLYQQRTPVLFFPWRTFVGLANLLFGALEKVPLLLVGSLPSLVTSAVAAVKNATRDREFKDSRQDGLRTHAEMLVKESLHPKVDQLQTAIRSDLRSERRIEPAREDDDLQVTFEGLELLQARSTTLFQEVLESRAVGRAATWITGLVGLAIFWSIFAWPFFALYSDYFHAIQQFMSGQGDHDTFPSRALPMIMTSFLLAMFPMIFWMLLVLSWVGYEKRAIDCLTTLRHGHQSIIDELTNRQVLRVHAQHPHLRACLQLFSLK